MKSPTSRNCEGEHYPKDKASPVCLFQQKVSSFTANKNTSTQEAYIYLHRSDTLPHPLQDHSGVSLLMNKNLNKNPYKYSPPVTLQNYALLNNSPLQTPTSGFYRQAISLTSTVSNSNTPLPQANVINRNTNSKHDKFSPYTQTTQTSTNQPRSNSSTSSKRIALVRVHLDLARFRADPNYSWNKKLSFSPLTITPLPPTNQFLKRSSSTTTTGDQP